jgi:hypothetical protein
MLARIHVHEGGVVSVGDGSRARAGRRVDGALARRGHERRRRHGETHAGDAGGDADGVRALGGEPRRRLLIVTHGG